MFTPPIRIVFLALLCASFVEITHADAPLRINKIIVKRHNVFDTGTPRDFKFPYSWGNKLHIMTREIFIRKELLFDEGDELNLETLEESERLLRRQEIFRYVKITPQTPHDGAVDVLVETDDVWTTAIDISFSLAGGQTSYRAGLLEQNFLGLGRTVGAFVRKDIDRTTRGVSYRNPQFLWGRLDLFGGYGRDEKGREWETYLERPFFAATTKFSAGVSLRDREDEDRLFEQGEESAHFEHNSRESRVFAAYALVAETKKVRRISTGYENVSDKFSRSEGPEAPLLPDKRRITPFFAGYDFQNLHYHKVRGVTTFDRDEDINTGLTWAFESGPFQERWGSTQNGWMGRFLASRHLIFADDQVWFNRLLVTGRMENGVVQNGVGRALSQIYFPDWKPQHTASVRAEYVASKNLDPETEFLLGGENGLRGYSVRQFSGSNKAIATLEDRRFWLKDWLDLVNLGWAYFVDSGAVWNNGDTLSISDIKSDAGAGIRISPSRSTHAGLIRMDVAYAMQDNRRSSRFVVNIGAEIEFGEPRQRKFDQ